MTFGALGAIFPVGMRSDSVSPVRGMVPMLALAVAIALAAMAAPASADSLCAFRTESGAIVFTNTPTNDGLCASAAGAPPIGPPSQDAVARYDPIIRAAAGRYGVSARLVHAVVATESAYNPSAVSPKGAQGLMQLMPATAKRYGVTDSFDATQNIRAGVAHLRDLLDVFRDNTRLAVAAYNAGQKAVERYSGVPPFAETREYVRRVMGRLGGKTGGLTQIAASGVRSSPVRVLRDSSGNIALVN